MTLKQIVGTLASSILVLAFISVCGADEQKADSSEKDAANILTNAGFEEGDANCANWSKGNKVDGVTYTWDKKNAKDGKASLCLKKTAKRYFPIAEWKQVVDAKPDQASLKISAQVKAENTTKAIVDVLFLDENSEWIKHEWACYIGQKEQTDKPANHDWKEYTGQVAIPPNAKKIQIGLQIYGPGTVWFDDVKAEYAK